MVVCAHGDVSEFCEEHDMLIFERHEGDLEDYGGSCVVLVTDQKMEGKEYDDLKCKMFSRGIELVSTDWCDDETIVRLLRYTLDSRKQRGGRQPFGFCKKNGIIVENPAMMAVARRVIELRDKGLTYQQISRDPGVRRADGRPIGISTLQFIVTNRDRYEK